MRTLLLAFVTLTLTLTVGCKRREEPKPRDTTKTGSGSGGMAAARKHDAVSRTDFNRLAVRRNLPVYWIEDANHNKVLDPDEVAALRSIGSEPTWTKAGSFTPEFETAYDQIVAASKAPPLDVSTEDGKRRSSCARISMPAARRSCAAIRVAVGRRQSVRQADARCRRI